MSAICLGGQFYPRCESLYFHKHCADRAGHDGRHHSGYLWWVTSEAAAATDPPEYGPDDAEAQRIAEACADANTEHDRIENEEAGRG